MKVTSIIIIFSFTTFSWGRSVSDSFGLKGLLKEQTKQQIVNYLNDFVKVSQPTRMVGTTGHQKAHEYILQTILKNDPKQTGKISSVELPFPVDEMKNFYQSDFDKKIKEKLPVSHPEYIKWKRFTDYMLKIADSLKDEKISNIIWEKEGINTRKTLVIVAHYDTISHDPQTLMIKMNEPMPGANYNGSGVTIALGLIKTISDLKLNYNLQIVFLDSQAFGFTGSLLHAAELKKSTKDIMGVLNLEMLGQDSSFNDKTKKLGNMKLYHRPVDAENKLAQKVNELGKRITQKVDFIPMANSFDQSDNFRYWDKDFPCLTFTQNWEDDFNPKFYQSKLDTPETLNHDTLYESYLFIGGSVLGVLLDLTK